ncbi:MAG: RNA polymerase sigma-70 factor [Saprospiraceae bacterium]|nr:RNA polymerase sigma-70 factor [Saprospiraceae bacterium]
MTKALLDRDSFRKLFKENYRLLCNYINAQTRDMELSQEIAQKTFVKLWEKRDEISFNSSSKSYLFQAARNTLIDHFRSLKTANVHAEQYARELPLGEEMSIEEDHELVTVQRIARAVDKLKPKTREIFLLSKKEGLTYDEIAKYLDISKRTVEYNMKNALQQLKTLLKEQITMNQE